MLDRDPPSVEPNNDADSPPALDYATPTSANAAGRMSGALTAICIANGLVLAVLVVSELAYRFKSPEYFLAGGMLWWPSFFLVLYAVARAISVKGRFAVERAIVLAGLGAYVALCVYWILVYAGD